LTGTQRMNECLTLAERHARSAAGRTAAAAAHAAKVVDDAAALGFHGVVAGLRALMNQLHLLGQADDQMRGSVASTSGLLSQISDQLTPDEVVNLLSCAAQTTAAIATHAHTAIDAADQAKVTVSRVLHGGSPGPLLAMIDSIVEDLEALLNVHVQLREAVAVAVDDARKLGWPAGSALGAETGKAPASSPASRLPASSADLGRARLMAGGRGVASQIAAWATAQGWTRRQTAAGPPKFVDDNGIVRVTIKRGSPRTPGSEHPHVELRNAAGQHIDPHGNPVNRNSPANHTPIIWDL
jgi:hypothetical protein